MTTILKALASLANILPGWLWAALCAGLATAQAHGSGLKIWVA
jgi:hypothetical protein